MLIGSCSNIATLDPSRLVNEGSGGNYYDTSNLLDVHHYPQPQVPVSSDRAVANSEFGGIYLPIPNHTWAANGQGVGNYVTAANSSELDYLVQSYFLMLTSGVQLDGLSEAAITQITDCETEMNGLYSYDRKVRKVDVPTVQNAVYNITAPFTSTVVLPTSQVTPQTWEYTTTTPPNDWYATVFDDSDWSIGQAGFGTNDPGVTPNTSWTTSDIWLRRTFNPGNLTAQQISSLVFNLYHDEDVQIYINGVFAGEDSAFTTSYVTIPISPAALATIVPNANNEIAVHCDQTTGGQFVDVGINDQIAPAPPAPVIPVVPTGVTAMAVSSGVGLSWNASPGASSYNIERSTVSGGPYTMVGTAPSTAYTDPSVTVGTTYYYVISAVNAAGASTNSAETSVNPAAGLVSVVSRQVHGSYGTFDLPLNLAGTPTVESRPGSPTGNFTIVVTFSSAVTAANATLELQAGQSGTVVGSAEAPVLNGNTVTINLVGVADAQCLELQLAGILPGDVTLNIPLNVLCGDVNGDGVVNSKDLVAVRNSLGEQGNLSGFNPEADLNQDGVINSQDLVQARNHLGDQLP